MEVFAVLIVSFVGSAFACDGFRAVIHSVENCLPGNPIFTPIGGALNVTDSCDVTSNACSIIQPYSTFTIELRVFDPVSNLPVTVEGADHLTLDICDSNNLVIPDIAKLAMVTYGIAPICPVTQPTRHCYDEATSMFRIGDHMRQLLPFYSKRGAFKIVMTTLHDTGSSCISVVMSFIES